MARKKQPPSLDPELLRHVGLILVFLLGIAMLAMAAGTFLTTSSLFAIQDIVVAEQIQPLETSDLVKFKGQNIFAVDLAKAEVKLRAKYPQLAQLHVMRRCPSQLVVNAVKREAFAQVSFEGRDCVIDPAGYIIGPPQGPQAALTLIRGLRRQKAALGVPVEDERIKTASDIIARFRQDRSLASVALVAVSVEDPTRIVCVLGRDDKTQFEAIIDKDNTVSGLRMLSGVLARGGLDLAQVKYIDLRFGEPVIGQKKVKK